MKRLAASVLGVLLTLAGSVSPASAQATAQINGTVTDSSGGVLPGVTVVAVQTETAFRREAVTDENGSYVLLNLPLGPYRLEATLAGFRTYAQTGIVLQVNSNPLIPIAMALGSVEETVSVEAAAPLVETRNPAIGQVVTNEQVEALPLEGRNPASLISLAVPAVDTGTPSSRSLTQSRSITLAGGQAFGVAYVLDGALHNNVFDGVGLPLPFPDAMQEFRVETSAQNAQNGYKGSGTVGVATKAGTNAFHGSAFEFARHHRFNATSPFARIDPVTGERSHDGLVRNQFGGVLGGPLVRNRVFFFAAYQGTRATEKPADIITFIPTAQMLAGDFSTVASSQCRAQGTLALPAALGFVNNRIDPGLFSPAAINVAKRLPTTNDPCGQIAYSREIRPREAQPIVRLDWQASQNQSWFARYMVTTTDWEPAFNNATDGNILAATQGGRDNAAHSFVLGNTHVLNSTAVNNLRVFVNRTRVLRTHAELFGPEDVGVNIYSYIPNYMNLTVTGAFSINTGTETFSFYKPNTYGASDDLTIVRGSHQFGFGTAFTWSDWTMEANVRPMGPMSFNGGVTGLPLADFLLGRVFEFRQSTPYILDNKQAYFALYGQDTWRLSPRFTLNYGARWEPWFPMSVRNNSIYNFDAGRMRAGTRSEVIPQAPPGLYYPGDPGFPGKSGMNTVWSNIAPRVGISWNPRADGRTAVRAGYGMTGDFVTGQVFIETQTGPPFGLETRVVNTRLDDPWGAAGRVNPYPVSPDRGQFNWDLVQYALLTSLDHDLKTMRNHSWNVAVQQQVGENMALSATYMGNRMMNIWGIVDGNPGTIPAGASPTGPCTLALPTGGTQTFANCSTANLDLRRELSQLNPAVGQRIGYLGWIADEGWQDYQGLMMSVERRSVAGLAASANYTISRCEGLVNQGGAPFNVGTGYMQSVSVINPPSDAERKAAFEVDKGRCDNWRKHILNVTATIESPQFTHTAARLLASGWRLSGIFRASSGAPLSVSTGVDRALSGIQATTQRANQVLDDPYGDRTVNNWFNPGAFAQPALGTYGNSPRNGFDGPGVRVVDLSLVRLFGLANGQRMEARVEAFNALNWFIKGNPIATLSNANFGRIQTLAVAPRVMQFAMKYTF